MTNNYDQAPRLSAVAVTTISILATFLAMGLSMIADLGILPNDTTAAVVQVILPTRS